MSTHCTIPSPLGLISISTSTDAITELRFGDDVDQAVAPVTLLQQSACRQLTEYFEGRRRVFELPLAPRGTPFQQGVWQALQTIPHGERRSYKDIAGLIGNPKAMRAVGLANGRNPISIIIPCHRVIGASGKLVGYASGLERKSWLLQLEAAPGNG
ncbi:methylated-DNA--[protein]-cysteine S-methyltransferase [Oceanisphaera arctica]|uniref:Methylated-DNA--protein-cysteine methyltransferase n=1 Tax=Oceanisphaera arctica TaxID=641510 RepID=A0A2P5TKM4_9GAMM|nr:methylated-DNA--[protein]-cysteine S-methyltransferase [Oceanisphaera arctica]PPL15739.1 cysteine methyltransferase [Oceanisphaera arctica]GHA04935.1 methylated-DNA--protein-cysteine methyltransferase [Oceanisphaera arctica]